MGFKENRLLILIMVRSGSNGGDAEPSICRASSIRLQKMKTKTNIAELIKSMKKHYFVDVDNDSYLYGNFNKKKI